MKQPNFKLKLPLMHTFDFETLMAQDRTELPLGMLGPAVIKSIVFRPLPRGQHQHTPLVRSHMFLEQLSLGPITYIRGPGLLSHRTEAADTGHPHRTDAAYLRTPALFSPKK